MACAFTLVPQVWSIQAGHKFLCTEPALHTDETLQIETVSTTVCSIGINLQQYIMQEMKNRFVPL